MLKIEDVVKLIKHKRFLENKFCTHLSDSDYRIDKDKLRVGFIYEGNSDRLNFIQCEIFYSGNDGSMKHTLKFMLSKSMGRVEVYLNGMETYWEEMVRETKTISCDGVPPEHIVELSNIIKTYVEEINAYDN